MFSLLLSLSSCRSGRSHFYRSRTHRSHPVAVANALCVGKCISESRANVRCGPSTSYSPITTITYGTSVEINGKYGNWWNVSVKGYNGFILASLLQVPGKVNAGVKIRSGPSTDNSIISTIKYAGSVIITDISNDSGWYKINGGWACAGSVTLTGYIPGRCDGITAITIRQSDPRLNSNIRNWGSAFMSCCWCGGVNSIGECNNLYNKAVSLGYMRADCYIFNWKSMATGIAGAKSYKLASADQYPPSNAKEILQCSNSKTTNHFVVGNGHGGIEYDPAYDGFVAYSDCQNKHFFYY